ncbi:type I-B CRISPR-associated protein Cas8b/Csh1 [Haloferax sp. Atlit-19N]|uniref:type I-B CRISPR-associated protein Cas8b/Csh1 n=1 Tax=Haloferax sp. Atlit-19N TaxID=2077201 RepID=UPI0018F531D2|nr:type I-B CRISPR-associated protein Cas8b/Csh1 [Haloferax sp. Atlit-19N]
MAGPELADFEDAIDAFWHGRPPASLEDVMALYGVLAVAESGGELYGTDSKLEPFVDDGRLVTIDIDLTGEVPDVSDPKVDTLRAEDVPNLRYAHKSSGRGAKYSLTQIGSKNGNDAAGVASTILGRVRSWTTQDSVLSVTGEDGHPDGWIVEELAAIFEKGSDTLETLEEAIKALLPPDESLPTVVTIRLRLDADRLSQSEESGTRWFWPAELDVLEEAMKRYATANAADKNVESGDGISEGESVGLVTDRVERVVGTPDNPIGVFSVKHPDAQPGLRQDQSWRNYPVGADTAMLFSKGQDLVEMCVLRRGGVETYALPYFAGELTPLKAQSLYGAIQSLDYESDYDESGGSPMARVTYELRESENEALQKLADTELRFYTITLPIGDDKNVIAEEPAAPVYWVSELADALAQTVHGPTLNPEQGGFAPYNNWSLLELATEDFEEARKFGFYRIVGHQFTDSAFAYRGDDEGDDFRRVVDHRLIAGVPLNASMLFDEYLRRYHDESEGGDLPPHQIVAQQLVHLETLSRAGLLNGLDVPIEPPTMTTETVTETDFDATSLSAIREHRLESFLDRPLFEAPARRAAALAGVLVGQVSWHQESERNIGRPLDAQTKGDQLTKNSLENALTSALEKAKVYALDSEYRSDRDMLFPETVDRLLETTEDMPSAWPIEKRELQFCYVLGHAHGRRSMPIAFDLHEKEDEGDQGAEEPAENTAN